MNTPALVPVNRFAPRTGGARLHSPARSWLILLASTLAAVGAARAGSDWPWWRGASCNGTAADTGKPMVAAFADARHLWTSTEPIPGTYEGDARNPVPRLQARIPGGYASPVVADGRVFLFYYVPNGPVFDRAVTERHVEGGGMGREQWFTDADDVFLCLDAATGRTLWKRVFVEAGFNLEAGFNKGGCQLTPCVYRDRVYGIGASARIYCVQAATGLPVWTSDLGIRARYQEDTKDGSRETAQIWGGRNDFGGCVVPAGDVVAVSDHWEYKGGPRTMGNGNGLIGFDAATGERRWYVPGAGGRGMLGSTPLRWVSGGRERLLAAGEAGIVCIDPATGRVEWRLPDAGFDNAAAVDANRLVCGAPGGGTACYTLGETGATLAWKIADSFGFSSPCISKDHLFMLTRDGLSCVAMADGTVVARVPQEHVTGSLALADGRLFVAASSRGKAGLCMFDADPAGLKKLGDTWPVPFANSTSPAVADGKVFFRGRDRVLCYDVTAAGAPALQR